MTPTRRAIVVAGPASGAGKTTIALGLMAACHRRGFAVQAFKCGPDFIDPGHHTRICGRPSRNLDGWMLSREANRTLFATWAALADIAIVEGVMGLFDGATGSDAGSTAAMAKSLGLPVLFVVDASHMAASVAALVRGFETFDRDVRIAGVLLNRVGSARHYELLRDALADAGCAPAVGYLPADASIRIPERHLGLHTADEDVWSPATVDHLASQIERCVDVEAVLRIATLDDGATPIAAPGPVVAPVEYAGDTARIAIARDRAFCFYYQDNIDALRAAGGEIVEFSPLADRVLPDGTDAVYIGGGYPELYAGALAANDAMRTTLRDFAARGGVIYAECGGLMYLASRLHGPGGEVMPMIGLLPFETRMTDRLVRFGYVDVRFTAPCLLGPAGTTARGHSFHYSTIEPDHPPITHAYRLRSTRSGQEAAEGYLLGNVLASYIHLHFLSNPTLASSFVAAARTYQHRRR
jgi:cobyrinic acid a,c-diamide synthase